MKCKFKKYKYITQDSGNIILSTNKKGKAKWVGWCPGEKTEDNKKWFVSTKNRELIIGDFKGICMVDVCKFKMPDGSGVGVVKNSTTVIDFKKLILKTEYFWKDEKKKYKEKEKCKKVKK